MRGRPPRPACARSAPGCPPRGELGAARRHYTLATGAITSQTGAGRYALGAFPARWHRIVAECLRVRGGAAGRSLYPTPLAGRREALAFMAMVLDDARRCTPRLPASLARRPAYPPRACRWRCDTPHGTGHHAATRHGQPVTQGPKRPSATPRPPPRESSALLRSPAGRAPTARVPPAGAGRPLDTGVGHSYDGRQAALLIGPLTCHRSRREAAPVGPRCDHAIRLPGGKGVSARPGTTRGCA
jgi:hypothetical protein